MYLPAFSNMENDFNLQPGAMSLSLSVFMLGLAVGQGLCGPVGDRYGRKRPLLIGVAVFCASSAIGAIAANFETLIAARFLQGLGGAACLVLPRTITADLYDEKSSATIFTALIQIQSISPILAPLLGVWLLQTTDWRGVFWMLSVCGLIGVALVTRLVPESRPRENTFKTSSEGRVRDLLGLPRYWLMVGSFASLSGLLFGYIAYANFIYVSLFKLDEASFGIAFAVNALGMIGCGFISMQMLRRLTMRPTLLISFVVLVAAAAALCAATIWFPSSSLMQACALFVLMSSLGLLFGGLTSETMFSVPSTLTGNASALLGVVQYGAGALSGTLIGWLKPETLLPIAMVMLAYSVFAALTWAMGARMSKPQERLGTPAV